MKTIEQWLNELPEPYRSQALENTRIQNESLLTDLEEDPSIRVALAAAFTWGDTPEGFEYWDELFDSLHNLPPH